MNNVHASEDETHPIPPLGHDDFPNLRLWYAFRFRGHQHESHEHFYVHHDHPGEQQDMLHEDSGR